MNPFDDRLLAEAIRIGDQLVAAAEPDGGEASWRTMGMDASMKITAERSPAIYNGAAGIALFLIELYRETGCDQYLSAAAAGLGWAERICREGLPGPSFYCGALGVSFALSRLADVSQDIRHRTSALEIARAYSERILEDPNSDLLIGRAGSLLGLLHLYSATDAAWVADLAHSLIRRMIETVLPGKIGLYWGRGPLHIKGLCGLSHGAAGVGFVLLEAAHCLATKAYRELAEEAFAYEAGCYDDQIQTWPDFRLDLDSPDRFARYLRDFESEEVRTRLVTPRVMNAWCHGAAGIGLSRLRAFELTGLAWLRRDAVKARRKTLQTIAELDSIERLSYTFCHGAAGQAEFFLEWQRLFPRSHARNIARRLAEEALEYGSKHGLYVAGFGPAGNEEDTSLFMGNAGVGYFYLRVRAPSRVPSIVLPRVASSRVQRRSHGRGAAVSVTDIAMLRLRKTFPRAVHLLSCVSPEGFARLKASVSGCPANGRSLETEFLQAEILRIPEESRCRIGDVFGLETARSEVDGEIRSFGLLSVQTRYYSARAEALGSTDREHFGRLIPEFAPGARICSTEWDWTSASPEDWERNLTAVPGFCSVLLEPAVDGVNEIPLSPLAHAVLVECHTMRCIEDVVRVVLEGLDVENSASRQQIREACFGQLREAFRAGFLVESTAAIEALRIAGASS